MPGQLINLEVGFYRESELSDYVTNVFMHHGAMEEHARTVSAYLLRADKARIGSHGMNDADN